MKLNDYFISEDFFNSISEIYGANFSVPSFLTFVINNAMMHNLILDDDVNSMNQTVKRLTRIFKSHPETMSTFGPHREAFISFLTEDTKKKYPNNDDAIEMLLHKIVTKDYKYHCTNTSVTNHTRVLDPTERLTSEKEMEEINHIFRCHGVTGIFGWFDINSKGKVFYATSPNVGHYSFDCPEFFYHFVCGAHSYAGASYDARAYRNRDYKACKNNLTLLMNAKGIQGQDYEKIMDFFERNWKIYGEAQSVILEITSDKESSDEYYELEKEFLLSEGPNLSACLDMFIEDLRAGIDERTTDPVKFETGDIIKLPLVKQVEDYLDIIGRPISDTQESIQEEKEIIRLKARKYSELIKGLFEKQNKGR